MASDSLRSVGGLQVASGWFWLFFVIASGWLLRSQWVAYVDSIGFICYSQWVAYANPINIICSSQWVACVVSFSFITFTRSASGCPVCSQWMVYAFSFVVLIFPVLDRSVGQRLA